MIIVNEEMKKLVIAITFCLLAGSASAQLWKTHRLELSGGIGTTQFFGDIGGYSNDENILGIKDFTFRHTRINVNSNLRYRITEDFSARLNITYGIFHSTDERGSNINRGFESHTTFFEPSLIAEYCFIKNKNENSFNFLQGKYDVLTSIFKSLDFYAFTGFGGLIYKVSPNDILAPEVTKRNGITGVVPLGLGVTMIFNSTINFGIEIGGRFTFSDMIDGYTSAKSQANDIYHFTNLTVTYKLGSKKGQ